MKQRILIYGLLLMFGVTIPFTGCGNNPTPVPDINSPGAKLYVNKCGTCHSLPHPKRLYYSQWKHIVKVMEKRMEQRGMLPITEREKNVILEYLKNHARK